MTDIDSLYAQFHAEQNRANYWQMTANEKALEIAQLLNERQMLREALIGLQTIPAEDTKDPNDRCWCGYHITGAGEHADYCVKAREALALAAPKE